MQAKTRKSWVVYLIFGPFVFMVLVAAIAGWGVFSYFYPWAQRATLQGHQGRVLCVSFAPDGQTLASGGADRTVRLWDLATGKERAILTGHKDRVWAAAFSPNNKLLATASGDGSVRLWDVRTGKQLAMLPEQARLDHKGVPLPVYSVAFSPDGQFLASGGDDETVRLWETATGKQRVVLKESGEVYSVVITADGKLLASRTMNGIITVWDLAEGKPLRRFGERLGGRRSYALLLAPDGKTLVSNDTCVEKVRLWDLTTGEERAILKADLNWQNSSVTSMALSPDGKILAGRTMFGGHMLFWDTSDGHLLGTIFFPPHVSSIAFSPDGKTLASAHGDGTIKLWDAAKLIPRR